MVYPIPLNGSHVNKRILNRPKPTTPATARAAGLPYQSLRSDTQRGPMIFCGNSEGTSGLSENAFSITSIRAPETVQLVRSRSAQHKIIVWNEYNVVIGQVSFCHQLMVRIHLLQFLPDPVSEESASRLPACSAIDESPSSNGNPDRTRVQAVPSSRKQDSTVLTDRCVKEFQSTVLHSTFTAETHQISSPMHTGHRNIQAATHTTHHGSLS